MISNLAIWCLTSGSEGMILMRCFLRQRSDERIGQQCRDHNFAFRFRKNTLSPVSICPEATVSKLSDSSVFFPADAGASDIHMPGTPRGHDDAILSMSDLHGDPCRALP